MLLFKMKFWFFKTLLNNVNPKHPAVGFENGHLQIVDSISLSDCLKAPFAYSKEAISHIEFSHDSQFMATAVKFI